jgi:conjugative transfer signal peptidase TraF
MTGRTTIMATAAFAIFGQLASAPFPIPLLQIGTPPLTLLPKLLLWNASASVPRGLYLLHPALPLHVDELVAVIPPEPLARFAALRGYLPLGMPLLKHVAALDGQIVCRFADRVTIDGHIAALARERDSRGRTLPRWQGCRTLRAGEVFLLNSAIPDSFDGRYFGALSVNTITARAEPLWIISEP